MILLINTCAEKKLILAVKDNEKIFKGEILDGNQAEKMKRELKNFIKKYKIDLNGLRGIIVVNGPGKFTSVRIGVSMANALAYALNIPILGINAEKGNDLKRAFFYGELNFKKIISPKMIMPFYDKAPNIT